MCSWVWVAKIAFSAFNAGLWMVDVVNFHSLLNNLTPTHDPIVANAIVMAGMYLITGPLFIIAPFSGMFEK